MNFLFAYGTITLRDIQIKILGRPCAMVAAVLEGYSVRQGRWPYLVVDSRGSASGCVLTDLSKEDMAKLDDYERMDPKYGLADNDLYQRRQAEVRLEDQTHLSCWVYFPLLEKWPHDWLEQPHA